MEEVKEPLLTSRSPSPPPPFLRRPSSPLSLGKPSRFRRSNVIPAVLVLGLGSFLLFSTSGRATTTIAGGAAPVSDDGTGSSDQLWSNLTPEQRLLQLNKDYDPTKEGFGVGNADLTLYRRDLEDALEALVGFPSEALALAAFDPLDEDKDTSSTDIESSSTTTSRPEPLLPILQCHLTLTCPSSHPIPPELHATAKIISPVPESLLTWQDLNPSTTLQLYNNADVESYIVSRFPNGTLPSIFRNLPIPILKYDLFRLVVLFARGGVYTDADTTALTPIAEWGTHNVLDLTDPLLVPTHDPTSKPELVIGIEWSGRTEKNELNPLYSRDVGVVQWTFGASKGHPVLLDALNRVLKNSVAVAKGRKGGEIGDGEEEKDRLHFDPKADRMVLEWSGPAVFSDSVARYLRTRYGVSLSSLARSSTPIRVGDVLILPIAALHAQSNYAMKFLDWVLGRNFDPLTREQDCVAHAHAASWWGAKVEKKSSTTPPSPRAVKFARARY